MSNGSLITNSGKKIIINRAYKSSPDYTVPSQFKVGINNGTPGASDTDLAYAIPIEDGVVNDDGSNQLTGSNGGDNSTDNTSIFKEGAGVGDDTAQNLITNATSATKTWVISDLSSAGTVIDDSKRGAIWLYIADATTLAYFKSSGTAVEVKLGSDSSNYYSKTWTASDLSTGWNWLTSNTDTIADWSETGTVGSPVDYFEIEITTNNAADSWNSGDVVYDLLRTWDYADLVDGYDTGYPTIDETNFEVETRLTLTTVQANGFDLNGFGLFNTDGTVLMHSEDTFTAESKSSTDQIIFIVKDRFI